MRKQHCTFSKILLILPRSCCGLPTNICVITQIQTVCVCVCVYAHARVRVRARVSLSLSVRERV